MKKYNICVVSSTRADYGLLRNLLFKIKEQKTFNLKLVLTGTHFLKDFGNTYLEAEEDKFEFTRVDIFNKTDSSGDKNIVDSMSKTIKAFNKYFSENKTDAVILLGDRYEIFSVALTAYTLKLPIFHLHGGEVSFGALDEAYRHCITKMSYLHFCSNETNRSRIIHMGEAPDRVFNVGALGAENIRKTKLRASKDILCDLGIDPGLPYVLFTYHPVTLSKSSIDMEMKEIFDFLRTMKNISVIITKSNADSGGEIINGMIDDFVKDTPNTYAYNSLGYLRYLSLMKDCTAVIGNSSSGIIEAPVFNVPTVNIGDRQKGRYDGHTIFNCNVTCSEIARAYQSAVKADFSREIQNGGINTGEKIVSIIDDFLANDKIDLKKSFHDMV